MLHERGSQLVTHYSYFQLSPIKKCRSFESSFGNTNPSPFGDRFGKVVQPKFLGAQDGKNDHAVCCTYANIDLLFWPKAIGKLLKLENVNPQFSWYKLELIEFFRGSPLLASRKSRSARNFDFALISPHVHLHIVRCLRRVPRLTIVTRRTCVQDLDISTPKKSLIYHQDPFPKV